MTRLQAWHDKTQWFRERDAWMLFKIAAFAEAFGWLLLAFGVFYDAHHWPKYHSVIVIAGRMHGTFFTIYILATLALSRSLRWRWFTIVVALAASVPPLGSLFFEQIMAHSRYRKSGLKDIRILSKQKSKILAWQAIGSTEWTLPGGLTDPGETELEAVQRYCSLLGIQAPKSLKGQDPYVVGVVTQPNRTSREHDDATYMPPADVQI